MWVHTPTRTSHTLFLFSSSLPHTHTPTRINTHTHNSPASAEDSHLTNAWRGDYWPSVLATGSVFVCVCAYVCVHESGQRSNSHCVCTNSPAWAFKSRQDAIGRTKRWWDFRGLIWEGVLASPAHMFTRSRRPVIVWFLTRLRVSCIFVPAETVQERAPAPVQARSR